MADTDVDDAGRRGPFRIIEEAEFNGARSHRVKRWIASDINRTHIVAYEVFAGPDRKPTTSPTPKALSIAPGVTVGGSDALINRWNDCVP